MSDSVKNVQGNWETQELPCAKGAKGRFDSSEAMAQKVMESG